ncbi:MAG: hypothetical protein PHS59_06450 [Paludibacter sp.]|nr:hypothetical protein [Paludibacter sp.]
MKKIMKKINYLLLLFAIVTSLSLQARQVLVSATAAFQTAFNSAVDKDTISRIRDLRYG